MTESSPKPILQKSLPPQEREKKPQSPKVPSSWVFAYYGAVLRAPMTPSAEDPIAIQTVMRSILQRKTSWGNAARSQLDSEQIIWLANKVSQAHINPRGIGVPIVVEGFDVQEYLDRHPTEAAFIRERSNQFFNLPHQRPSTSKTYTSEVINGIEFGVISQESLANVFRGAVVDTAFRTNLNYIKGLAQAGLIHLPEGQQVTITSTAENGQLLDNIFSQADFQPYLQVLQLGIQIAAQIIRQNQARIRQQQIEAFRSNPATRATSVATDMNGLIDEAVTEAVGDRIPESVRMQLIDDLTRRKDFQ